MYLSVRLEDIIALNAILEAEPALPADWVLRQYFQFALWVSGHQEHPAVVASKMLPRYPASTYGVAKLYRDTTFNRMGSPITCMACLTRDIFTYVTYGSCW